MSDWNAENKHVWSQIQRKQKRARDPRGSESEGPQWRQHSGWKMWQGNIARKEWSMTNWLWQFSCKERVALNKINMAGKIDIHEWGLRTQTRTLLLPNVVEGLWGAHDEKADMIIVIMMMKFSYDYCTGGELGSSANWVVLLVIIGVGSVFIILAHVACWCHRRRRHRDIQPKESPLL